MFYDARMGQRQTVGEHLREWRQRRRMSQLGLALEAGISTRHLSLSKPDGHCRAATCCCI